MNSNQTIGRSNSKKHYHEQSMDDFMKNIKKFNLRSQRYISPKPFYMYAKNNTTNTIEKSRSRTLSNHKSHNSKSKRSKKQKHKSNSKPIQTKLEKIFHSKSQMSLRDMQNPAHFIEKCGNKLKKAEKFLEGKSGVGSYLCEEFLKILNEIVEKMVNQLDRQLKEIQYKTQKQIQRKYINQVNKLQKKIKKMDKIIIDNAQKADNNSKLLYSLRMATNLDIDHIFGRVVLGTDQCGGQGYSKNISDSNYTSVKSKTSQNYDQVPETKNEMGKYLKNQKNFGLKQQNIPKLKFDDLRRQINQGNQFIEKESGRIRQAYDWEREAHDDQQRFKKAKNAHKYLVTDLSGQQCSQERERRSN